jgi:prolyl oligopeptidase
VFYVLTDNSAPRYRLVAIDVNHPEPEHWREIIPEQGDVLVWVEIINESFVAEYMHDAHSRVALYEMDGRYVRDLELPTIGSVGSINGEREEAEMFYSFTSFLYPQTIFRFDFTSGETSTFRAPEIDFDPSGYETRQVFYPSADGTNIPMFITHRKGMRLDGSNPTYLYGYGGFNISRTPSFSISNLVWMEMGGVYASANLRGGGEYGEEWHKGGMKENKQNVFDDFIAAAEYLIAETGRGCHGHAAVPQVHHRLGLGIRLRLARRPRDVPAHLRLLAVPQHQGDGLPGRHGHHGRP